MRFGAYVLFMLSIVLVFYFMGYKSEAMTKFQDQQAGITKADGSIDIPTFLGNMAESALAPQNLLSSIVVALAAVAGSLILGYAAIYIIPIAMLIFIVNYVVFPFSFVIDPGTPDMIRIPVMVFLNALTMLAILSFVRGGNV